MFHKERKESEVAQLCPTICDPMDTRILRPWDFLGKSTWVSWHFLLRGTSQSRDWTQVSHIVDRRFTICSTCQSFLTLDLWDSSIWLPVQNPCSTGLYCVLWILWSVIQFMDILVLSKFFILFYFQMFYLLLHRNP